MDKQEMRLIVRDELFKSRLEELGLKENADGGIDIIRVARSGLEAIRQLDAIKEFFDKKEKYEF